MSYPTTMNIAGVTVPVTVHDKPVRAVYNCPVCKDAETVVVDGEEKEKEVPFQFYAPYGATDVECPACKRKHVQPTGFNIFGTFDVTRLAIDITANSEEMGMMNLVHETIEAINTFCDLRLEHTQISTLGAMLAKAFTSGSVDFTAGTVPGTTVLQ